MNDSAADVEAFADRVYLDSGTRAPNHTLHPYRQPGVHAAELKVFVLFKINKTCSPSRQQIII